MNEISLDRLCGALSYAIGIEKPQKAALPDKRLTDFIDKVFSGEKADRIFLYHPDAIAQWIDEKYSTVLKEVKNLSDISVEYSCPMPSVTPVCFATMLSGSQPEVHGIQKYEKPVLTIDTFFDALIRNGKKVAIVSEVNFSYSKIFLNRNLDYYIFENISEINAKAMELIYKDEHDCIFVYNGNYDSMMHKFGPESREALSELRSNSYTYATFVHALRNSYKKHNTFYGFAMDHGCHEIDKGGGSHGLYMEEDINIRHYYGAIKKSQN